MRSIHTYVKQKRLYFLSCAIVIWVAFAFWVFQPVHFETNDDEAMAKILYGIHGDKYENHMVFINLCLGKLLCGLLEIFPGVPWYGVSQCLLVLCSFFVITYLILRRLGTVNGTIPLLLFIFFFGWEFFCNIQFSKTAGIAVSAGFLLLFDTIIWKKQRNIKRYIVSSFLIVFGSMYRFVVFEMLLIPMFGIGLFVIYEPLKNCLWKDVAKIALPFIVIFAVCFGLNMYDNFVYQSDSQWSEYVKFNQFRSELLDYGFPEYEENKRLYESLGISEEDLDMYRTWDFNDPETFTTDALEKLVEAKDETEFSEKNFFIFLISLISRYKYSAVLFLVCAFSLYNGKKHKRLILVYELLAFFVVESYLYLSGRYNLNRIDVSVYSSVCVILILYCWDVQAVRFDKLSCALLSIFMLVAPFANAIEKETTESKKINNLISQDKDNIYISPTLPGLPSAVEPFTILPIGYLDNVVSLGGWKTQSPLTNEQMSKYGIENLFRDIVDNENAYLICAPGQIDSRLSYIQRHYSPDAQAQLIKLVDSKYYIYRITTHGPKIDTSHSIAGEDFLKLGINPRDIDGALVMDGYLVMSGINSYKANLYLGVIDSSGKEQLQYLKQHELPVDDIMNGLFSGYVAKIDYESQNDKLRLYLENGTELYHYDLGSVAEVLQAGPSY